MVLNYFLDTFVLGIAQVLSDSCGLTPDKRSPVGMSLSPSEEGCAGEVVLDRCLPCLLTAWCFLVVRKRACSLSI